LVATALHTVQRAVSVKLTQLQASPLSKCSRVEWMWQSRWKKHSVKYKQQHSRLYKCNVMTDLERCMQHKRLQRLCTQVVSDTVKLKGRIC